MGSATTRPSLAATLRAKQVLVAAGLDPGARLEPVAHTSNEVWLGEAHVLRIVTDAHDGRLELEAHLSGVLPPTVPHARVLSHGTAAVGGWLVMERVPGRPLSEAWPTMTEDHRRTAVSDIAAALRALHAITPSVQVLTMAVPDPPHPLPGNRVHGYLMQARLQAHTEPAVMDALEALLEEVGDAVDPAETTAGLVHGDLHFDNVMWDGAHVSALVDLEWMRPGPADLDLDVLLEYCAAPELSTQAIDRFAVSAADLAPVPRWLELDYPELFAHPRIDDRLMLYRLAYDLRALLRDPPGPNVATVKHHPYNRLRRLAGH